MDRKKSRRAVAPTKRGRKTKYRPEFDAQVEAMCFIGATDKELAEFFGVSEVTILQWCKDHPSFSLARKAKERANAEVARALYRRAVGYAFEERKFKTVAVGTTVSEDGEEILFEEKLIERAEKELAPDPGAAMSWLTNRDPERWRNKQDVTVSANPEAIVRLLNAGRDKLAKMKAQGK